MPIFSEDSYYNAGCGDQLHSPKNIIEGTITAIANDLYDEDVPKSFPRSCFGLSKKRTLPKSKGEMQTF